MVKRNLLMFSCTGLWYLNQSILMCQLLVIKLRIIIVAFRTLDGAIIG